MRVYDTFVAKTPTFPFSTRDVGMRDVMRERGTRLGSDTGWERI